MNAARMTKPKSQMPRRGSGDAGAPADRRRSSRRVERTEPETGDGDRHDRCEREGEHDGDARDRRAGDGQRPDDRRRGVRREVPAHDVASVPPLDEHALHGSRGVHAAEAETVDPERADEHPQRQSRGDHGDHDQEQCDDLDDQCHGKGDAASAPLREQIRDHRARGGCHAHQQHDQRDGDVVDALQLLEHRQRCHHDRIAESLCRVGGGDGDPRAYGGDGRGSGAHARSIPAVSARGGWPA